MPTARTIAAVPYRLLARAGVPHGRLPARFRPTPMRTVREVSLGRDDAVAAVRRAVPAADAHLAEFTEFWEQEVVEQAIEVHARFGGEWAGAGPVDFLEGWALYSLVRERRPERVLEVGFAHGISSWVLGTALTRNGTGSLDTVDVSDEGETIPQFKALAAAGVIRPHVGDGIEFAQGLDVDVQMTFCDALHTLEFNRRLAQVLRRRWPDAVHVYHEWSLSPVASAADARYVSLRVNLGSCGEREAFEEVFPEHRHIGIPSSSGLGLVLPPA